MRNLTISIDDELYTQLKKYDFLNWSALCRIIIKSVVNTLEKDGVTKEQLEEKALTQILALLR